MKIVFRVAWLHVVIDVPASRHTPNSVPLNTFSVVATEPVPVRHRLWIRSIASAWELFGTVSATIVPSKSQSRISRWRWSTDT